jgi:hypothetical protein
MHAKVPEVLKNNGRYDEINISTMHNFCAWSMINGMQIKDTFSLVQNMLAVIIDPL